jgi:hypothetical protein
MKKMKKTITFFFILTFLISCLNNENENVMKSKIKDFETFLGKEQSEAFTEKVNIFESFLKINFPNLSIKEAYKRYLQEIVNCEYLEKKWNYTGINRDKLDYFVETSGLRKEIYSKPDTVWIQNGNVRYRSYYIESGDTLSTSGGVFIVTDPSPNFDSIICEIKNEMNFNIHGRFIRGLELIQGQDSTIIKYLDDKYAIANISPSVISDALLYRNADFSNYFVKRIVVAELF